MAAAAGARAAAACRSSSASSSSAGAAMPQCAVATCRNSHRKTRGRRVRYHRFPAEAEARGRWVAACGRGRDGAFNASTARVCSLHFSARSYERDVQHELLGLPPRSRLRRGAVPDRAVPHAPDVAAAADRDLDADVSCSVGGGDGIDVLLALGLTPTPRAERERRRRLEAAAQSAGDDAAADADGAAATDQHLNKMHVMDEECKLETAAGSVISENAAASATSDGAIDLVIGSDRKPLIVNSTVASPAVTAADNKTANNSAVPATARNATALATNTSSSGATPINNCNSNSNSSSENTTKPVELKQELKEELDDENAGVEKIVETISVKQSGSPAASRKRPSSDSDSSDRKKPRIPEVEVEELEEEEEWERERSLREAMNAVAGGNGGGGHSGSNEEIELRQLAERLRREIGALAALARAKEHEWNSILRLKKLKEESLVRLQRRRQVLMIEAGVSPENCGPAAVDTDMSNLPVDENMIRGTSSPPSRCSSSGSPPRTTGRGSSGRGSRRTQNQQSAASGSVAKGNPLMMVPVVSSSPANGQSPRERRTTANNSRPLLPKPTGCNSSPPLGQQQQNTVIGEGRKGPILDVRSIIADYRSKNPGDVPRRGRRLRGATSPTRMQEAAGMQLQSTRVSGSGGVLSMASIALGSGSQMRPGPAEIGDIAFPPQEVSRPSSADSGRSDQPGISFKDVLMQFARLSQEHSESVGAAARGGAGGGAGAPFPEVTLHPVAPSAPPPSASPPPAAPAPAQAPPSPGRGQSRQAASLLHGILSGQARASSSTGTPTAFSPTLARLLTAPERHPGPRLPSTAPVTAGASSVSIADLLSTNKTRNEITITPVSANSATKPKEEIVVFEELDDSTDRDRLVIDEGEGEAESVDDVPECQGCHQMAAQFVCAACGNQWYCSRDCQVAAWDEHSETCSG